MPRPKVFGDRVTFTIRCEPDLLERMTEAAEKQNRTKNALAVEAIEAFLSGPPARDTAELEWWRHFACKIGPGDMPPVGSALLGRRYTLTEDRFDG